MANTIFFAQVLQAAQMWRRRAKELHAIGAPASKIEEAGYNERFFSHLYEHGCPPGGTHGN